MTISQFRFTAFVAHFREDFTTDFTDFTDGKEGQETWKAETSNFLFVKSVKSVVPCLGLRLCRAAASRLCVESAVRPPRFRGKPAFVPPPPGPIGHLFTRRRLAYKREVSTEKRGIILCLSLGWQGETPAEKSSQLSQGGARRLALPWAVLFRLFGAAKN
jgi:hypothetical protein